MITHRLKSGSAARSQRTPFSWAVAKVAVGAARNGNSDRAIARVLGCAPESLSRWKRLHPKFGLAMERARAQPSIAKQQFCADEAAALSAQIKALQAQLDELTGPEIVPEADEALLKEAYAHLDEIELDGF